MIRCGQVWQAKNFHTYAVVFFNGNKWGLLLIDDHADGDHLNSLGFLHDVGGRFEFTEAEIKGMLEGGELLPQKVSFVDAEY